MRLYLLFISLFITSLVTAQSINDVLRYSQYQYNSTARSSAVAGAFGSLGADISVASINPAGIAEFRKSEFTIGIGGVLNSTDGTLSGNRVNRPQEVIKLTNVGAVFVSNPPNFDTKTFNIAVGVNNIATFNNLISYSAFNSGTRVERWLELANGNRIDELGNFEAGPAYDAEAILANDDDVTYRSDFDLDFNAQVQRSETIERSGGINEIYVAVASNKKNKFSWGIGVGIPIVSFNETKTYTEEDTDNQIEFFNSLAWDESLKITGAGINIKAGIIYKLSPQLRLGAAIHSPTIYTIQDDYNTNVTYNFNFDGVDQSRLGSSPDFTESFEYQLTTPWRANGGLSYLYKAGDLLGFISGDVEYVNYSAGSIDLASNSNDPNDQFNSDDINNELNTAATSVLNYRIGTELAYQKFRIRGGVSLTTGPWVDESKLNEGLGFSGGLGYRANNYYVDVSYTLRPSTSKYTPYNLVLEEFEHNVAIDRNQGFANLTVGTKF